MAVSSQHPWVQGTEARGNPNTPQQTCHPGILCYRSRGSNHCPGQNTTAPPGSLKTATLVTSAKIPWLILLNLADVGRKDLNLKGAALYSVMRPQHKAFCKTLPFRGNITGNPKKYGKKTVTSLSSPEPYIFNTASNSDFRTIVPAAK